LNPPVQDNSLNALGSGPNWLYLLYNQSLKLTKMIAKYTRIDDKLTKERLLVEHLSWTNDNGDGRNEDNIRFGQFIHIKYNIEGLLDANNDGWNNESSKEAFDIIYKIAQ
jgi:hypothetical protein